VLALLHVLTPRTDLGGLDEDLRHSLCGSGQRRLGRERVAVSCIILVTPMGEQPLAGSAFARQGENESIVRATLDAINRRLNFLTTP